MNLEPSRLKLNDARQDRTCVHLLSIGRSGRSDRWTSSRSPRTTDLKRTKASNDGFGPTEAKNVVENAKAWT
ncbi:hypothetical protein L596_017940 [Steinernema carpocapsae]|uniref:Uncharacterized protein n=1 Tax=Steinernema carpocapsae TaxID=34508 RepID=A0A4V6XW39_STECR|nr:hypothetical protein L596_017940 [Steinernema carpocapsae]